MLVRALPDDTGHLADPCVPSRVYYKLSGVPKKALNCPPTSVPRGRWAAWFGGLVNGGEREWRALTGVTVF